MGRDWSGFDPKPTPARRNGSQAVLERAPWPTLKPFEEKVDMKEGIFALALGALLFGCSSEASDFASECFIGVSPVPQLSSRPDKDRYVSSLCSCADMKVPELEKEVYVLLAKLSRLQPGSPEYKRLSARLESLGNQEELDQRVVRTFSSALQACLAEVEQG